MNDYLIFGMTSTNLVVKSCRNAAQIYCFCIEQLAREISVGFFVCLVGFFVLFCWLFFFFTVVTAPKYY